MREWLTDSMIGLDLRLGHVEVKLDSLLDELREFLANG